MDRSLLNKATRADDDPTPGYLYNELAAMTFVSPTVCADLFDALLKKLQRGDSNVKLKTLKIIKHVSEKGRPEFRRLAQRKADVIRGYTGYRGPPHPLRGDAPSKTVREEADACLKTIFLPDNSGSNNNSSIDQRILGFGRDSADTNPKESYGGHNENYFTTKTVSSSGPFTPPDNRSVGGHHMQGFGNPHFASQSNQSTQKSFVGSLTGAVARALPESVVKQLDYMGVNVKGSNFRGSVQNGSDHSFSYGPNGSASMTGGSRPTLSYGSGYGADNCHNYQTYISPTLPPPGVWTAPPSDAPRHFTTSTDPGVYEAKLVADICAPGGATVTPPTEVLKQFHSKCEMLDEKIILMLLMTKVSDSTTNWQQRLRALSVVDSMVDHRIAPNSLVERVSASLVSESFELVLREVADTVPECRLKCLKILQQISPKGVTHFETSSPANDCPSSIGIDLLDCFQPPQSAHQRDDTLRGRPSEPAGDLLRFDDPQSQSTSSASTPQIFKSHRQAGVKTDDLVNLDSPVLNASVSAKNFLDISSSQADSLVDLTSGDSSNTKDGAGKSGSIGPSLFNGMALHTGDKNISMQIFSYFNSRPSFETAKP